MHIIIDGDPFMYRIGFASESHCYLAVFTNAQGKLEQKYFSPLDGKTAYARLNEFMERNPKWDLLDKKKVVEPEPLAHCLGTLKRAVNGTVEACLSHFGVKKEDARVSLLIRGEGNFREKVATMKEYKVSRKDAEKPYWFEKMRKYLIEWQGARPVNGHEADDECSILAFDARAFNMPYVVCSIDKDLDQIPGWHYDYARKIFYHQDAWEGKSVLWQQCLSGDGTDDIPGIYRIGTARAQKLVDTWYEDFDARADLQALDMYMWDKILETWTEAFEKHGAERYAPCDTPEEAALETARLVFMLRYSGQLWTPPGEPDEVIR